MTIQALTLFIWNVNMQAGILHRLLLHTSHDFDCVTFVVYVSCAVMCDGSYWKMKYNVYTQLVTFSCSSFPPPGFG
jgi:hypothetical protein